MVNLLKSIEYGVSWKMVSLLLLFWTTLEQQKLTSYSKFKDLKVNSYVFQTINHIIMEIVLVLRYNEDHLAKIMRKPLKFVILQFEK